jgi:hypothetical protein
MKKLIAVAVLVAAGLTAPAVPAYAATSMSKASLDCLVFPMFKKQCWQKAEAMAADAASSASAAAHSIKLPVMPWGCKPAPAGSGHMLDC